MLTDEQIVEYSAYLDDRMPPERKREFLEYLDRIIQVFVDLAFDPDAIVPKDLISGDIVNSFRK